MHHKIFYKFLTDSCSSEFLSVSACTALCNLLIDVSRPRFSIISPTGGPFFKPDITVLRHFIRAGKLMSSALANDVSFEFISVAEISWLSSRISMTLVII